MRKRSTKALNARYGRSKPLNVAYHEAGHAVVAEHLGLRVGMLTKKPKREMSIDASTSLISALDGRKNLNGEASAEAEAHLTCALAGKIAEEMVSGARVPNSWHPYDTKDIRRFKALIGARDLKPYESEAKRILQQNWPQVEAVAKMYLASQRVYGKAIRQAMR